jgi:hypothetical protein
MRKAMIVPGAAVAALAAAGCATGAGPGLVMTLEPSTTRVEGWLASDGELTVFPRPLKAAYDPYAGDERARCVSVIDATGQGRAALAKLNGRRVIVTGEAVAWDALADGTEPGDRLLGRKFYGEQVVLNGCVRSFVFVARTVVAVK